MVDTKILIVNFYIVILFFKAVLSFLYYHFHYKSTFTLVAKGVISFCNIDPRWWIPTAIKVLALMNAANNLAAPHIIDYTEFNNVSLDHMDLMQEYYNWQNPGLFLLTVVVQCL